MVTATIKANLVKTILIFSVSHMKSWVHLSANTRLTFKVRNAGNVGVAVTRPYEHDTTFTDRTANVHMDQTNHHTQSQIYET